LFNIAIGPIIRNIQGEDNEQKILAYADELVLLSDNPEDMQKRLDESEQLTGRINIQINPNESFSMHLSGVTPVGTRDTLFRIKNKQIRSLRDGEIDTFLGMPVGLQITRGLKEVAKLMETANKILQCNLAPWQKFDALKSFYFPSLNIQMRTAHLQKGDWTKLEEYI
jgi:hypothetical protein